MAEFNATIKDLTLDTTNINAHTKRGVDLTNKSIDKFGSRLAGILDKHGNVIDANLRTELYADKGIENVQVVKASKDVPVYLQYDDLDLHDSDNPARELQLALHRSSVESFEVDAEMLSIHLLEDETIADDWYFESELQQVLKMGEDLDYDEMWKGMPEFEQDDKSGIKLIVHFENEEHRQDFARLVGQKLTEKTKYIWHPYKAPENLKSKVYTDEP